MGRAPDRRPPSYRPPGGPPRRDGPDVNDRRPQAAEPWRRPPPPRPGPGGPDVNDRRPQAAEPWRRPPPPRPGAGPGRSGGSHGPRPGPYRQPGFRPPPPPDPNLLGPDEELVAGRRPVEEAFVAKRPAIRLLVVPQRRQALERLVLHATSLRIPIVEVEGGTLTALAGFDGHQGIALVAGPRRWSSVEEILARGIERAEPAFVLVLDSLEDPQNVGTLLRSAEAAGVHGVVFPTRHQAPLTPSAVKASAGAVEHLLLAPVDDLAGALSDLHSRGVRIVGAEAGAPLTARQADFRGPLAIVVGSEGQGLSPAVRRRCDLVVRIPMRGVVGSLNAAVAGSVLLFEAVAQRDPAGAGDRPPPHRAGRSSTPPDEAPAEATAPEPPEPTEPDAPESAASSDDDGTVDEPTVDDADLLPGGPRT